MCPICDGNRSDRRADRVRGRQNNRQLTFNDTIYSKRESCGSTSLSKNNFNAFSLSLPFHWAVEFYLPKSRNTTTCPSLRECRQMNNFMIRWINPNCISSSIFSSSSSSADGGRTRHTQARQKKGSADNVTRCEVNGLIHHQNWLNVFTLCCSLSRERDHSSKTEIETYSRKSREHGIIRRSEEKLRSQSAKWESMSVACYESFPNTLFIIKWSWLLLVGSFFDSSIYCNTYT